VRAEDEAQLIAEAHDAAQAVGEALYRDPLSGLYVFTAAALSERGYCCASDCRHCPFPPET